MIKIPRSLVNSLMAKARESSPMEMCGLAIGHFRRGEKIVDELIYLDNTDPMPTVAYTVDASQLVETLTSVDKSGKTIIGIFHSHPRGPNYPSAIDLERVAWLDHSHLIIVPGTELGLSSWQWDDHSKKFSMEKVKIV